MARQRVGGLRADPEVLAWQEQAATNIGALTKKQRQDRKRVRVKYDVSAQLKDRVEAAARVEGTSASQLAAFLLEWAMAHWEDEESEIGQVLRDLVDEKKRPSRSMRIEWNLQENGSVGI